MSIVDGQIWCLRTVSSSLLPVTSTGTTTLPGSLHLKNILVSPYLIKNLISVHQFTSDNNCYVEFDPAGCSVKDLLSRKMIVRCNSSGPLYHLCLLATLPSALLATSSISIWHHRLGHPRHEALSKLAILSAMPVSWVIIFVYLFMCRHLVQLRNLISYIVTCGLLLSLVPQLTNII
jgi:hypothetical protein